MTRRLLWLICACWCLPCPAQVRGTVAPAARPAAAEGFAVVELFTSQGCSSCPPADRLLSELVADAARTRRRVYAMSFHVDFWNRLGWTDPFSKLAFTKRQNNYVSALGAAEVYTPEAFVNGAEAFVGSDRERMHRAVGDALAKPAAVPLTLHLDSVLRDTLFLSYAAGSADRNYSLVTALVERGLETRVGKGENKGKLLKHDNVVRVFEIFRLTEPQGRAAVPTGGFKLDHDFSLFAYVQQKQTKHILGAAAIDF